MVDSIVLLTSCMKRENFEHHLLQMLIDCLHMGNFSKMFISIHEPVVQKYLFNCMFLCLLFVCGVFLYVYILIIWMAFLFLRSTFFTFN